MRRNRLPVTPVSHLTYTQAGRYIGVSQAAVTQRAQRFPEKLPTTQVLGVNMVSVKDCQRWIREIRQRERERAT